MYYAQVLPRYLRGCKPHQVLAEISILLEVSSPQPFAYQEHVSGLAVVRLSGLAVVHLPGLAVVRLSGLAVVRLSDPGNVSRPVSQNSPAVIVEGGTSPPSLLLPQTSFHLSQHSGLYNVQSTFDERDSLKREQAYQREVGSAF
jgi:hypothetical protein